MKSHFKIVFLLIAALLLNYSAYAQKSKKAATTKPKKNGTVLKGAFDTQSFFGTVEGSVYKNSFFGLKINLPENWIIQGKEVNEEIKQFGEDNVKGKNRNAQKAFDQALDKVTILLTATKDIIGISNNALFNVTVEKPMPTVRFRDGNDYLRLALQSYKLLQLPPDYKYSETITAETLGGEKFYYIDVERTGYTQRFYATARKGYALFFLLQFSNAEDLETMKDVLRNSDFTWKG